MTDQQVGLVPTAPLAARSKARAGCVAAGVSRSFWSSAHSRSARSPADSDSTEMSPVLCVLSLRMDDRNAAAARRLPSGPLPMSTPRTAVMTTKMNTAAAGVAVGSVRARG